MSARVVLAIASLIAAGLVSAVGAAVLRTPPPATLVLRRADLGAAHSGRGASVDNANAARGAPPGAALR